MMLHSTFDNEVYYEKTCFHCTLRSEEMTSHRIATKKSFKKKVCQNLTFETFCIKELIHRCQRRHAQVPV